MNCSFHYQKVQHIKGLTSPLLIILFVTLFLFAGYGCNIFEEGEGTFNLVTQVLPSTAGTIVTTGTGNVELLAVPNENWIFSHWSGDVESTTNPLQITLTQNTQVFANFSLSGNDYRILLSITDGQFISDLEFGQVTGATDGFDTFIDLEAPPSPPDGVLFAWFEGSERPLLYDYRNPFAPEPDWNLVIRPGNRPGVKLTWEIETARESGTWILMNEDESVQIDMRSVKSVEFNIEEVSHLNIVTIQ
ncbi:MAG: hypothetical protein EA359_14745 [Balneolaceae bacterium]|nr:MAG: hypothetical protein EA359_14745 [Balneolaceae bacterium]